MITFQEILRRLAHFWEKQNCIVHQGYDMETGAGTMNPATFLRCLGPEPYRAAYIEPCRRPADGRYGENPNRLQHYFQYQVILKPSPLNMQELYLESLKAIGADLSQHDIRFVHDDWENPTIGAWGLGWEVWMDGMEITQYTYFQSVGGLPLKPITGELTYGIERIAMYLQNVDSIFDLQWNDHLTYGDIYHRNEVEFSHYNFDNASTDMWFRHFSDYEKESKQLIEKKLPLPAYDFVMKASHAFNILDARGAISVTERAAYIGRIRDLAKMIAESYVENREAIEFPLINRFPFEQSERPTATAIPDILLNANADETDHFLLEIGSEELPAVFVPIGMKNLELSLTKLLNKLKISYQSINVYGTPRRLTASVEGLSLALAEKVEERRGPAVEKAFDENGALTPAGKGFFKSIGKEEMTLKTAKNDPQIELREVKGNAYLFVKVTIPGQSTAKFLADSLEKLILDLDFPKKMRWADLDISYARPLQWVVAMIGSEVIPLTVGNLLTGNTSRGHRQLNPGDFTITSAKDYLSILREHNVLADPKERKQAILDQLDALESSIGAKIIEREAVIPQVLHLVEWPQATAATFDTNFLKVPKEVLISEMVEHQKYFPVADAQGKLLNHFIITADTTPTDHIRKGNQKVLSARLSDGVFLYEKGVEVPFETFNEKLKNVTYLSGMGSLYDKVLRLEGHCEKLQKTLNISTQVKAHRAARLSKGDLVSEMVFEFPELQGTIGKYYAEAHGEDPEVALAIEEQWMPKGENDSLPSTETGTILSLADKFDNLLSCFAAGLKPTSSSDPHALRRQALGIIKILIDSKLSLPFRKTLESCCANFDSSHLKDTGAVVDAVIEFFTNRIKTVFQDYGFSKDEIEASVAFGFHDIYDTFCRVKALHGFRKSGQQFSELYEVYKRAKGQLNNHQNTSFSKDLLVEEAEIALDQTLEGAQNRFASAIENRNYDQAYQLVSTIQAPLAKLFDEVRILDEDQKVQDNRIALLHRVFSLFGQLLDFSKIQEKKGA